MDLKTLKRVKAFILTGTMATGVIGGLSACNYDTSNDSDVDVYDTSKISNAADIESIIDLLEENNLGIKSELQKDESFSEWNSKYVENRTKGSIEGCNKALSHIGRSILKASICSEYNIDPYSVTDFNFNSDYLDYALGHVTYNDEFLDSEYESETESGKLLISYITPELAAGNILYDKENTYHIILKGECLDLAINIDKCSIVGFKTFEQVDRAYKAIEGFLLYDLEKDKAKTDDKTVLKSRFNETKKDLVEEKYNDENYSKVKILEN